MGFPRHAFLFIAVAIAASVAFAGRASADQSASDKAAAETLFVDARKAFSAGRYEEACRALEQSQRLDPGIGTLLNLGRCYEKLGRTASAWTTYREAASMARASGQKSREQSARRSADVLDGKLAHLTIVFSDSQVNGLEVRRDGTVVSPGTWGVAIAVDPGEHAFQVSAPGKKTWTGSVTVEPGKTATFTVPALENEPSVAAATPEPAPPPKSDEVAPPPNPATAKGGGKAQRVIGITVAGAGLAAAGVAGALALNAKSIYDKADCNKATNVCSPEGYAARSHAYDRAALATGFGIGAAVAITTGLVLWATAPSGPRTEPNTALVVEPRLTIVAQPFGEARTLTVSGTF